MAVAFGSISTSTTGSAVTYPAGVSAGDLLVLVVLAKISTAVISTPSGWTSLANSKAEGGSGSESANQGTVEVAIFVKEADGSEAGTVSTSVSGANHQLSFMARYTKGGGTWSYAASAGSDNAGGNSYSATGNVDPGIAANDLVVVAAGVNTDNSPSWSSHALSASGITTGTATQRAYTTTTTGSDSGLVLADFAISAGPSSDLPTYSMTGSGLSGSEGAGAAVLLRLREDGSGGGSFQAAWALGSNVMIF